MQLLVLSCTFLTLSEHEECTAEKRQLSEQGSAPIIRALMISALMIGAQQCHPPVPPTCVQQCHPPVPRMPPRSAASQCPAVAHVSARHCRLSVLPISATYQCHPSLLSISTTYQCHLSVPPILATSLVPPISAASLMHIS
ncbi:unnamed protein product, partial [Staurois parvus]